jgi:cell fate (sporulation/competence/biofilm development) regulator YlbF (YheA/YmcA/DUF963 family)
MAATIEETVISQKTRELCQAILDEPGVQALRKSIDSFMADETARAQYDGVVAKGQALQQKQQMSEALSDEEIADFEQDRDALLKNPVANDFLDAQQQLRDVQESIQRQVKKTFELGRLPSEEDLASGCCSDGGGCGCGH